MLRFSHFAWPTTAPPPRNIPLQRNFLRYRVPSPAEEIIISSRLVSPPAGAALPGGPG